VKTAAGGKKPIIQQAKIKIIVLKCQFKSAMQGEASSQLSHPSAHSRHSNEFSSL
jgi:hypothetical protein